MNSPCKRIVFFGTYDTSKPRVRILMEAARIGGWDVIECHAHIWEAVADKSTVPRMRLMLAVLHSMASYLFLLPRYLLLPRHDAVIVSYPGALDAILVKPLAWLRSVPVVWDVFIPLHEALASRGLDKKYTKLAHALRALERLAARMADSIFLDTETHARFAESEYGLPFDSVVSIPVGAESKMFAPQLFAEKAHARFCVLFYGQFAPLHGLHTVIDAAKELEDIAFVLIGSGQETLPESLPANIAAISFVPYAELPRHIAAADACLGVFGAEAKTARIIPNKVFQILACRRPLITADTPAIRELIAPSDAIQLVAAGNADALAEAIRIIRRTPSDKLACAIEKMPRITEEQIAPVFDAALHRAIEKHKACRSAFGAAFPARGWVPAPRYALRRARILSHLRRLPCARVLEIGCGAGALLNDLEKMGWECTGAEESTPALALARKCNHDTNIHLLSDIPEQNFDVLMAFEVLEHIEDARKALNAWLQRLNPGGMLLLSVPAHPRKWCASDILAGHYRRYAKKDFIALVEGCGCGVEAVECYGWPMSNIVAAIRNWRDARVLKRMPQAPLPSAMTPGSGIDRKVETKLYPFYSGLLGRMGLRVAFLLQRASLHREWGTGYLLIARKPPLA